MTVAELILALQTYDPALPVELRAYCCTHTHPIKVEAIYAQDEKQLGVPPTVATVVISDEGIRWWDDQAEKDANR